MISSRQHRPEYRLRSGARRKPPQLLIVPPLLQGRGLILAAVAVAVFSGMCFGVPAQSLQPSRGRNHTIVIKQMHFDPASMTVQAGDTVEWKNEDIFSHTVTADDGSFDSGLIDPGHSWQMTFKGAHTLAYHCGPHPNMRATLIFHGETEEGTPDTTTTSLEARRDGNLNWRPPRKPEELHPILVNFTAALLPLALLSDLDRKSVV